jgi:adenylate kinase
MIFVAGVSRAGKSSTIEAFAKARGFTHIRASVLLHSAGRPLRQLSNAGAAENQRVLVELLRADGFIGRSSAILDGHATIETSEGIFFVPDTLFDQLNPSKIVCIINDPAIVAHRRTEIGYSFDPKEVSRLQEIEERSARMQATRLRVPYYTVEADDLARFAAAIDARGNGAI